MTAEMFDSIDPSQIPAGQDDAGYVDGRWRTFTALHGPHNLSVAVFASDDADALDDEPGDATNAQAPGWVRRELSLGHWRPCLYTSVSNLPALLAALAAAGITRAQVRIWTAHYTYRPHRCTRACNAQLPADFVADASQWTDRSGGRNLDESTIADDFFAATPPAPKGPPIVNVNAAPVGPVVYVPGMTVNDYWVCCADGGIETFGNAPFYGSQGGTHLNAPAVGMAATPTGKGYWIACADGGVFNHGDAVFDGSEGGTHLNAPIISITATLDGHGYLLQAHDGGLFNFGDAAYNGRVQVT